MRREGRQHGWVCAYDRAIVDPEGNRRAVGAVAVAAPVANGGFVRAPRKPTNHSKFTGSRAFRAPVSGKGGATAGVTSSSSSTGSNKGRRKFKHDELKSYYLQGVDAVDWHSYDDMD